jgi:glutaredoxin-related protein
MSNNKKLSTKLKDEPPPPPLTAQEAKDRSVFIRDNIKIVIQMRDQGKSFEEMKDAVPNFSNNYPHLFIELSKPDFDMNNLNLMLSMLDKMGNSNQTQNEASIKVGTMLKNKYINPNDS